MSLPASWRLFQLFDVTPIKDPNFGTDEALYSDGMLSCMTSTKLYLVLTTNNAFVKIINKSFTLVKSFSAYELDYRINFVGTVPNSNLLVTLAERQGYPSVLKLWDLTKIVHLETDDEDCYKYKFQTQVLVHNGDNSFPISCMQMNDNLTCIAIGYTNGRVILIRGDLLRDRGSKQRIIYESHDPITGIQFNVPEDLLYITTTSSILTVLATGRNQGRPTRILSDKLGVDLDCSDIDPKTQELIVGVPSSIRYYNSISKSHTINFEIPKKLIDRFGKNYLLIVSPTEEYIDTTKSKKLLTKIIIVDLFNKHISFTMTIPNVSIKLTFEMWDDLYLLSTDGILHKIHEKSINQQIEHILQRELFPIAYNLATQSNLPKYNLQRIQRLHGDYLYEKQQYEESIKMYIEALSFYDAKSSSKEDLEDFTLSIITKFKDVFNIPNLTKFLLKLYQLNLANNDHITLLLCCFCKVKNVEELDRFINYLDLTDSSKLHELNFQLIINLFKECGYFEQVIKLLYKLNQPSLIVDIELNDLHQPRNCLTFIKSLSIDELLLILVEHSKTFLDYLPIETTELLINVFTGNYVPIENAKEPAVDKSEEINEKKHEEDQSSFPLDSYRSFLAYIKGSSGSDDESEGSLTKTLHLVNRPTYLPPRPSIIYSSFVNNPNEFVIFLEACIEALDKYQGNLNDKRNLLMTLYEMYLSLASEQSEEAAKREWTDKASELLKHHVSLLDRSALLIISHIYNFKEGEIIAKEESGFEKSLFTVSQSLGDVDECIHIVYKYGESQPELYKMMLKYAVSKKEIFDRLNKKDFDFVLNQIKIKKLVTPLEIVQILSGNDFTTLGLVKDYLIDFIDEQKTEISNNVLLATYYENESTKNTHKLAELVHKPFIMQNNKCFSCNLKLDFPMVHFMCKHSFHQKCLSNNLMVSNSVGDSEKRCPICINELDEIRSVRLEQFKSKDNVAAFEDSLNDSSDRFKFICDYLGKGVMENESVTVLDA